MSSTLQENGLDESRLQLLKQVMEQDVEEGKYHGAVIMVARNGVIGLQEAIGNAVKEDNIPMRMDHAFSLFSTTKAFTNILVFRAIEAGVLSLRTKVSEIISQFAGGARESITLFHCLTHSSGLPFMVSPVPGMNLDNLDDIIAAICENVYSDIEPGEEVRYSPILGHALMGEMVRRTDPKQRSFREIIQQDLFDPLHMHDASMGVRADLKDRHIFPIFQEPLPFDHPSSGNHGLHSAFAEEFAEMPWVGCISTVPALFRFAEMLRCGGELDGARIVSPAILDLATKNWTGDKPNGMFEDICNSQGWDIIPAYLGLGFLLRGKSAGHLHYGSLASPRTFGNMGAGSSLFWVDPERQLTFVCLSSGVMNEAENMRRYQKLSDMAVAAAL
jgi:CubicO group peptidase (beta-lactamase class C family)